MKFYMFMEESFYQNKTSFVGFEPQPGLCLQVRTRFPEAALHMEV